VTGMCSGCWEGYARTFKPSIWSNVMMRAPNFFTLSHSSSLERKKRHLQVVAGDERADDASLKHFTQQETAQDIPERCVISRQWPCNKHSINALC